MSLVELRHPSVNHVTAHITEKKGKDMKEMGDMRTSMSLHVIFLNIIIILYYIIHILWVTGYILCWSLSII